MENKKRIKKYKPLPEELNYFAEPPAHYTTYTKSYLDTLSNMGPSEIIDYSLSGDELLEVQDELGLNAQNIAEILGISKSKYYDLLKLTDIGTKNIDALADFANVWKKGLEAFDNDQSMLNTWMESKNKNLGMVKPVDLLSSRIGRRELEKAFHRIEYSLYG